MSDLKFAKKLTKDFALNFMSLSASQVSAALFSLLIISLLTRLLSVEDYGRFGLFLAVSGFFTQFALSWILSGIYKYTAEASAASRSIAQVFWTASVALLGLFVPAVVLFVLLRPWLKNWANLGDIPLSFYVVFSLCNAGLAMTNHVLQGSGDFKKAATLGPVERLVFLGITATLLFSFVKVPLNWALMGCIISNAAAFFLSIFYLNRRLRERSSFDRVLLRQILLFSAPFLAINFVIYLNSWLDVYLLSHALSKEQIGHYYVALQFYNMATQIAYALNMMLLPILVNLLQSGRKDLIERYLDRLLPLFLVGGLLALLAARLAIRLLLPSLIDTRFHTAVPLTLLFLNAMHANFLIVAVQPLLFAQGKSFRIFFAFIIGLIASASLYTWLIPTLGTSTGPIVRAVNALLIGGIFLYQTGFGGHKTRFKIAACLLAAQAILLASQWSASPTGDIACLCLALLAAWLMGHSLRLLRPEDLEFFNEMKLPAPLISLLARLAKV